MAKQENRNWIVRMEVTVIKDVCVADCTKDEARKNPWAHAQSEQEVDMHDWEVRSVEPNE